MKGGLDPFKSSKPKAGGKSPNRGPKSITCYVCGKGFTKASIGIHLPQCKEKFKKESENLGVKRKLPKEPEELQELIAGETIDLKLLDQYNEKASSAYNNAGLMK